MTQTTFLHASKCPRCNLRPVCQRPSAYGMCAVCALFLHLSAQRVLLYAHVQPTHTPEPALSNR